MLKLYYKLLCILRNLKTQIRLKRRGIEVDYVGSHSEIVNLHDGLFLMQNGFVPARVIHVGRRGNDDLFCFIRTPLLLMLMQQYQARIRKSTEIINANYDYLLDELAEGAMPESRISPIDSEALSEIFAPHKCLKEACVYVEWPVDMRQKYIAATPQIRSKMIDAALNGEIAYGAAE